MTPGFCADLLFIFTHCLIQTISGTIVPTTGVHKSFISLKRLWKKKKGGDWLQEHVNVLSHKAYLWLRSRRPSGKGLIAIAIRPQKPLRRLMTPLTIMEPTEAYLWLIKPLIKAHVGNNVDIYYGTIEIRAELKLTFGCRDGVHWEGNHTVVTVQHPYLKPMYIRPWMEKHECKVGKGNNKCPHTLKGNSFVQQFSLFFPCLLIELHNRFSCFCQVCTTVRHNRADKTKSFEESFDNIWLPPAVSHSLLCGRGTEGMHAQLSGLWKLFTSLKLKDYTRFTAGRTAHIPAARL